MCFKNFEGKPERKSAKRTISISGGIEFELLQMVLEVGQGDVLVKKLSPEGGGYETVCQQGRWVLKGVDCEIPHRLGRRTKHCLQGCGNLSVEYAF